MFDKLLQLNRPAGWPEELPPRSYLYNLEPLGFNGATREDLRSYFQRLCIELNLAPWSVANNLISPLVASWRKFNPRSFVDDWHKSSMCGRGQTAADWSRALNLLTAREDLQLLTLLHVQDLLSDFLLPSRNARYCPQCYADDIAGETDCYNRLLWTIDVARACPVHEVTLLEGCSCSLSSNTGRKIFVPGRCPHCAQDLSVLYRHPAHARDTDAARRVAELLDAALYFSDLKPNHGGVAQFLNHAIATLANGVSAHFAAAVGVSKSSMHGWQNGRVVPSFPVILRIAQYCDVGIADVLLGNKRVMTPIEEFSVGRAPLISRATRSSPPCYVAVSKELEELMARGEAIYVSETAKAVGVSDKFLRRRFPEAVQRIVQNGRHVQKSAAEARRVARRHAYFRKHEELVRAGKRGSRREVLRELKADGLRMGRHEAGVVHRLATAAPTENS